ENNLALSLILKQKVTAVLEVVVANSGGAGKVRIRVEQGKKSWEERVDFAAREQRTVRISLPDAEDGFILFGAEADPPAPLFQTVESQPRDEGFWNDSRVLKLIVGIIFSAVSLLVMLIRSLARRPGTAVGSLPNSGAEVRQEAVCSI